MCDWELVWFYVWCVLGVDLGFYVFFINACANWVGYVFVLFYKFVFVSSY